LGERGLELASASEVVTWPDVEDAEVMYRAARTCSR